MTTESVCLRLLLGDQLNLNHSWFKQRDDHVLYVLMEMRQETDYVLHHIQKVLAFFSAMRSFAQQLQRLGHRVLYLKLDDPDNTHSLTENLARLIRLKHVTRFEYQLPDEYRLDQQLRQCCRSLAIPTATMDTEHFLADRTAVAEHFRGKKQYLLESFYRSMRRRYGILMNGNQPWGGAWNYDQQNREPYRGQVPVPEPLLFHNDVGNLKRLLAGMGVQTFGYHDGDQLIWPINREQAMALLSFFVDHCLPYFGTYEDAMSKQHWSMFHSRLSFVLNTKMLHPLEVVEAAVQEWQHNSDRISLPQIEGFVRQIIGWREYMRGVYWAQMPDYENLNFFEHERQLPHYYWDGQTKMQCLRYCIEQSLHYAFAHHIQRLMITGNFALLAGVHPDEVDAWYLGIYLDAIQWVEITNTRGMSQFADGGLVATKPYVATAKYIQRMSDYCEGCFYDAAKKYGTGACPFNSLYWAFYNRHRQKLEGNPRLGMMYRLWDRFAEVERCRILEQAERYLDGIEEL
ncbi:MAG: cryptochrome/photolyase family protein [candidate division KSB1 bacterium]|nr:cryptochrome/photolyase family protein [candidate division KSB1 bacterium]